MTRQRLFPSGRQDGTILMVVLGQLVVQLSSTHRVDTAWGAVLTVVAAAAFAMAVCHDLRPGDPHESFLGPVRPSRGNQARPGE